MRELDVRLKKLENLRERVSGMLIFNISDNTDPNFLYLTNFDGYGIFYYDFNEPVVFTAEMELARSKLSWVKKAAATKSYKKFIATAGRKKIGIDKDSIDAVTFEKLSKKLNVVDISDQLEKIRAIKTEYEIKSIRSACNASKRAWKYALNRIDSCDTEMDLRKVIDKKIIDMNFINSFPTIVASGKNIQYPHYIPGTTKIGRPLLVDFGVKVNGYCSDVTRTIGSRYEKITLKAIDAACAKIKDGAPARSLDIAARKALGRHSKHFITSLGHGIGLQIHERPYIHRKSKDVLCKGMVITIEPGIYVPNGIRIEDDVLVTEKGFENLTEF